VPEAGVQQVSDGAKTLAGDFDDGGIVLDPLVLAERSVGTERVHVEAGLEHARRNRTRCIARIAPETGDGISDGDSSHGCVLLILRRLQDDNFDPSARGVGRVVDGFESLSHGLPADLVDLVIREVLDNPKAASTVRLQKRATRYSGGVP